MHSKKNSLIPAGSVHSKHSSLLPADSVHLRQNSIVLSESLQSASGDHQRIASIASQEEQDQNPKYISAKEFETLINTRPFDEVLENVM